MSNRLLELEQELNEVKGRARAMSAPRPRRALPPRAQWARAASTDAVRGGAGVGHPQFSLAYAVKLDDVFPQVPLNTGVYLRLVQRDGSVAEKKSLFGSEHPLKTTEERLVKFESIERDPAATTEQRIEAALALKNILSAYVGGKRRPDDNLYVKKDEEKLHQVFNESITALERRIKLFKEFSKVRDSDAAPTKTVFAVILRDPVIDHEFTEFLKSEFSEENFSYYKKIQEFRNTAIGMSPSEQFETVKQIYNQYIGDGAPQQINIPSQILGTLMMDLGTLLGKIQGVLGDLKRSTPDRFTINLELFDESLLEIETLMLSDSLRRFMAQGSGRHESKLPGFKERMKLAIFIGLKFDKSMESK